MRPGSALLLALAVLLAGCLAEPPAEPEEEDPADVAPDGSVHAPTWNLGDHWTYASADGAFTLVVSDESGGEWVMDTTSAAIAEYHTRNDVSYLGEIRKSDLAGTQAGARVEFFRFPLEDGKTWRTTWDGVNVEVTATATDTQGLYQLTAMNGARKHAEYAYNAETRFFDEATWYDEEGLEAWHMRLEAHGTAYTGTLHRYTLGKTTMFAATSPETVLETLHVDAAWNELGIWALLFCNGDAAGQLLLGINSPDHPESPLPMSPYLNEPEEGYVLDCMGGQIWHDGWVMANSGGDWEIGILVGSPNGIAHLFLEERAHEEIPFP